MNLYIFSTIFIPFINFGIKISQLSFRHWICKFNSISKPSSIFFCF